MIITKNNNVIRHFANIDPSDLLPKEERIDLMRIGINCADKVISKNRTINKEAIRLEKKIVQESSDDRVYKQYKALKKKFFPGKITVEEYIESMRQILSEDTRMLNRVEIEIVVRYIGNNGDDFANTVASYASMHNGIINGGGKTSSGFLKSVLFDNEEDSKMFWKSLKNDFGRLIRIDHVTSITTMSEYNNSDKIKTPLYIDSSFGFVPQNMTDDHHVIQKWKNIATSNGVF